jgi:uncharacterized protein (DUF305 family)
MSSESELSLDQLVELERRAAAREAAEAEATDRAADSDADVLVLPWWQRPFNIGVLVVTAALLAGMVGWLIGDSGSQPEHSTVDIGFLHDMREHHEQAVFMGLIFGELDDTNPGLQLVATTIVRGQSLEVGRMIQLLRSFGAPEARTDGTPMDWMGAAGHAEHGGTAVPTGDPDDPFTQMPGMATEDQLDALAAASGAEADALFVELMTAHHRGGIDMAAYAVEHAQNDEVVKMAAGIVHAQEGEIVEMENLLR